MDSTTTFRIPLKRYWIPIWVYGATTVFLGGLILLILFWAFTSPDFVFPIEFIFYLFWLPIFFTAFMWYTFGYEELIIHDSSIELIQSFRIFSSRKHIQIHRIKAIEVKARKNEADNWSIAQKERIKEQQAAILFWYRMGQLIVRFKGGEKTFFNGLSYNEAILMKEQIEVQIKKRQGRISK